VVVVGGTVVVVVGGTVVVVVGGTVVVVVGGTVVVVVGGTVVLGGGGGGVGVTTVMVIVMGPVEELELELLLELEEELEDGGLVVAVGDTVVVGDECLGHTNVRPFISCLTTFVANATAAVWVFASRVTESCMNGCPPGHSSLSLTVTDTLAGTTLCAGAVVVTTGGASSSKKTRLMFLFIVTVTVPLVGERKIHFSLPKGFNSLTVTLVPRTKLPRSWEACQ
jgi:hypothetical protein